MKKLISVIALVLSAFSYAAFTDLEKVEINPTDSKLVFIGKKVTGQHTGEVKLANGHLNFKSNTLIAGEFEIDMKSISNTDLTDPEYHTKFLAHMNSEDFFNTDKFKTATLKIKSAKKIKGDAYKIKADLTIKGITAPVAFDAVVTKAQASSKIVFDRTKYGIKFKSGKYDPGLGDKLIYDEVTLDVTLVAIPVNKK